MVTVEFTARPGEAPVLIGALKKALPQTRSWAGCEQLEFTVNSQKPDEMMIVLQHRFWDLAVTEEGFEVKLTFDGIPERLYIPFEAIRVVV